MATTQQARPRPFAVSNWVPPLGDLYLAVVLGALVAILVRAAGPAIAVAAVVAADAVALTMLRPSRLWWAGGVARRLDGTELVTRSLTGRTTRIDLRHVRAAGLSKPSGLRQLSARLNGRVLVLAQNDYGPSADARSLRRLGVPADEAAEVAASATRAFGVILGLGATDEVLRAIGPILEANSARLSPSLRRAIAASQAR